MYLIETNFQGEPLIPEHRTAELTLANAVVAVRSGEDVRRVLCLASNGFWYDATREVAQAIVDGLDEPPEGPVQDFLENVFGCRYVADLCREMA